MTPVAFIGAAAKKKPKTLLVFPWILFAFVLGLIWVDYHRAPSTEYINAGAMKETGVQASAPSGAIAVDPVCGMQVRTGNAYRVVNEGTSFYFCSSYCRDAYKADPAAHLKAHEGGGHTMRGIPTWMYQVAVALLILVSFGLLEWISRRSRGGGLDVRVDLLKFPGMLAVFKSPYTVFILRAITAAAFILVIVAGLFGSQNPAMNIAPLLTWTVWWAGLIFIVLFLGKAWCTICPWDALATWVERLKFWGPRGEGLGLGLKWPSSMRNIWPAVVLFLLLTWVELGMGLTLIPRATAWVALAMLGMAIVSVLLFDRKAFCRYGCLVGRVSGLYALFSSVEIRAADKEVCGDCKSMDCFKGNEKGDPCPTSQFLRGMELNTYCTMCTECIKSCPEDNVALNLRPWGSDLAIEGRPRTDEAFLSLVLLSMTGFHGLTMTPSWPVWNEAVQGFLGVGHWTSFSLLMSLMLALPIAVYAGLVGISQQWSAPTRYKPLFLNYAYALLPIALFYHLAHNAEHFLMEGPKLIALLSDPFGWGWNLFGTAAWKPAPWVTLEGLWWIQILFVLVGHIYSLWVTEKTTRRLVPLRSRAFLVQLPMLAAMVLFSVFSLWLLKQPMEMRVSAM
jgi:polyferredoxin/YHS domain-containing protein